MIVHDRTSTRVNLRSTVLDGIGREVRVGSWLSHLDKHEPGSLVGKARDVFETLQSEWIESIRRSNDTSNRR